MEVTIEADLAGEAANIGLSCVRAAIHAAGGQTPDWDESAASGDGAHLYALDGQELRPLASA